MQSVWLQAMESSLSSCSVPSPPEVSNVSWKVALLHVRMQPPQLSASSSEAWPGCLEDQLHCNGFSN
ncbi:hypothetical protein INR49_021831 [Caranx melampygus]|nr:hypothetical protein INR49_021831 [Caranx melampygus]